MENDMNILIVEDDDLDVEILERGLRKLDATATLIRARDGEEALEILTADAPTTGLIRPFIVLLDINMPRMNGHELLARIRADEHLCDLPVFVFTTSDNPADIDRAYRHNVNGYIVKPNGISGLQDVLQMLDSFWKLCKLPSGTARAA